MAASKKITLSADGNSATVADASITDVLTTVISQDTVLTGTYGLVQKGLLFVGGMAVQNKRVNGSFNPLQA